MKKIYLLIVSFIALNALGSAQDFPTCLSDSLQSIIDERLSTTSIKGLAVNVILDDGSEWTGSAGISSGTSPIDTAMLFEFGGQRQSLLVATVLKLQEDGLLSIEDSIGKYLTGIENVNTSMPIKRFFNHTSGAASYWESGGEYWNTVFSDRSRVWSLEEVAANIPEGEFSEDPDYNPNRSNHIILAMLVEEVSGNPIDEEIENRVFIPLGMTSSYIARSAFDEGVLNGVWNNNNGNPIDNSGFSHDSYLTSRISWVGKIVDNAIFTRALHSAELLNQDNTELLHTETPGSFESYDNPREGIESYYGYGSDVFNYGGLQAYGLGGNSLNQTSSYHFPGKNFTLTIAINAFNANLEMAYTFDELFEEIVEFNPEDCAVGVFSGHHVETFSVYPNPASEFIKVNLGNMSEQEFSISIVDMSGRKVQEFDIGDANGFEEGRLFSLDPGLEEGIYLLKVTTESAVSSAPLVIVK